MKREVLKIVFFTVYFLLAPLAGYYWNNHVWVDRMEGATGDLLTRQMEILGGIQGGGTLPIPSGAYRIGRTVNIENATNARILGDRKTVVRYEGPIARAFLSFDNCAYSFLSSVGIYSDRVLESGISITGGHDALLTGTYIGMGGKE